MSKNNNKLSNHIEEIDKEFFEKNNSKSTFTKDTILPIINLSTLIIICFISFFVRVFSVIKYESIIHEFDPWFNFRATKYLVENGREEFYWWFDEYAWYPLGRFIGHTIFPGLLFTANYFYVLFKYLLIPIDIKDICVFTAPFFSMITCIGAYLLTYEITNKKESGLLSALFIAIIPSYLSRSVAGSYDNEAVAITALVITFYLFIKSINTGSLLYSCLSGLSYYYMVASWGGYSFIITFIPLFVFALIISNKVDLKCYVAYNIFYILGNIFSMQVKFVETKILTSSEHLPSHFVFIFIQIYYINKYVQNNLSKDNYELVKKYVLLGVMFLFISFILYIGLMGKTSFSARVMTLLDPSYASRFIPIIASVSEHQPTSWASFFFDLHFTLIFAPIGIYYCLKKNTNAMLFITLYCIFTIYFSGVMIRLLLVLAPSLCILSGIGLSALITKVKKYITHKFYNENNKYYVKKPRMPIFIGIFIIILIASLIVTTLLHGTIIGSEVYSSPTVILSNRNYENGKINIIDDFRNAYYWIRKNTPQDAKIMSWWDYGYQLAGFSNRTTFVDNNTWNYTHIAYVGRILASNEEEAYELCEKLDVDYFLVLFGGLTGYTGDDINKFIWMVRIAGNSFPHIKESDFTTNGYRIDNQASEKMKESMMYKFNYYRFWEVQTSKGLGYDTTRKQYMGVSYYIKT